MPLWRAVCLYSLAAVSALSADLPPEVVALARLRERFRQEAVNAPPYTCYETVGRASRPARASRYRLEDRLELEVSQVQGQERFGCRAARRSQEGDLFLLTRGGLLGTGDLLGHARTVLLGGATLVRYAGSEVTRGRSALRYRYEAGTGAGGLHAARARGRSPGRHAGQLLGRPRDAGPCAAAGRGDRHPADAPHRQRPHRDRLRADPAGRGRGRAARRRAGSPSARPTAA